jgi:hypothetical protein
MAGASPNQLSRLFSQCEKHVSRTQEQQAHAEIAGID